MFNLLMSASGWQPKRGKLDRSRVLEHTSPDLFQTFKPDGAVDFEKLLQLPALFAPELGPDDAPPARIGSITRVRPNGRDYEIEYEFDADIAPIDDDALASILAALDVTGFETQRTHWAVKEADLYHVMLRSQFARRIAPTVFRLNDRAPSKRQVAAMMPFASDFDEVYRSLKRAADSVGKRCDRADDIWRDEMVLQDVVSLISGSMAVICDLTGRNPNVFYEMGIAHTIGRPVIPVAQSKADIPFDVQHLRYVVYSDDVRGRALLEEKVRERIAALDQRM